jgi:hypothetical protein
MHCGNHTACGMHLIVATAGSLGVLLTEAACGWRTETDTVSALTMFQAARVPRSSCRVAHGELATSPGVPAWRRPLIRAQTVLHDTMCIYSLRLATFFRSV